MAGQKIRIRLKAYDHEAIDASARKIVETVTRTGARVVHAHNIHPTPKDNREWNESQAPQAPALEKSFAREEVMLPVKCNQHPWMRMFVNVSKSPFFAVTGPDGKYEIKGLPPGDYTIAFVHEKFGEQTQKVTLAAKDSKTVDATFKP
jgi:hypothetical protein